MAFIEKGIRLTLHEGAYGLEMIRENDQKIGLENKAI